MKKLAKRLVIVLSVLIILLGGAFLVIKSIKLPVVDITNVNLRNVRDGSYTGEYSAGPVKAVVKVVVENNRIADVKIEQHLCGLGRKAETIADEIVKKQTLDVDAVSGATLSSRVILKAVEIGLTKGTDRP